MAKRWGRNRTAVQPHEWGSHCTDNCVQYVLASDYDAVLEVLRNLVKVIRENNHAAANAVLSNAIKLLAEPMTDSLIESEK